MPSSETPRPTAQSRVGTLGEQLVGQWLQQQGYRVLAQQWHSRWGELDIVAQGPTRPDGGRSSGAALPTLVFVEVKTRSRGNWDGDGLLAITANKQAKLWKTAQLYLAKHPGLMALPCRFDVALVQCKRSPGAPMDAGSWPAQIKVQEPITQGGYVLTLRTYLESAFMGDGLGAF